MWCAEYELPHMRKLSITYDQQLQALTRRHDEAAKNSHSAFEQYMCDCGQAGLAGDAVEYELASAIAKLPLKLQPVFSSIQHETVRNAIESYSSQCDGSLAAIHDFLSTGWESQLQTPEVVQYLYSRHTLVKGKAVTGYKEYDINIRMLLAGHTMCTDSPVPLAKSEAQVLVTSPNDLSPAPGPVQAHSAWDIFVAASGTAARSTDGICGVLSNKTAEDPSPGIPECQGHPSAWRLAFQTDFRSKFVADLHELHGYLLQRSHEQETISGIPGFLPNEFQNLSYDDVKAARESLDSAMETLQNPKILLLVRASGSRAFTERFISKLHMHLKQVW